MTTAVVNVKRAAKLLKDAGTKFIAGFSVMTPSALQLRSKDPGVCWKVSGGAIAYATIIEFSGPTAVAPGAPYLLRLRTNAYPPPAIFYHLRSPVVRNKLGVGDMPMLCNSPIFELTGTPEEIGQIGRWFATWSDYYYYERTPAPSPPVDLVSWGWNDDGSGRKDNFMNTGSNWRNHLYLWTPAALTAWEDWLAK